MFRHYARFSLRFDAIDFAITAFGNFAAPVFADYLPPPEDGCQFSPRWMSLNSRHFGFFPPMLDGFRSRH